MPAVALQARRAIFVSSFPRENGGGRSDDCRVAPQGQDCVYLSRREGAYLNYVGKLAKAGKTGHGFDHAPTPRLHPPG